MGRTGNFPGVGAVNRCHTDLARLSPFLQSFANTSVAICRLPHDDLADAEYQQSQAPRMAGLDNRLP